MLKIGIRKENPLLKEKRAPLVPSQVEQIIKNGIKVYVQSSPERIFNDDEYKNAGAKIVSELSSPEIILGVKEIPLSDIKRNKIYLFFSHTIKGQKYNMLMLKKLIEKNCTLIDYELIKDEKDKRLVFFGDFAGYAGIINTLWAFGERIYWEGKNNLFKPIDQTHQYGGLQNAKDAIAAVGERIRKKGTRPEITPLIIGVTGRGRVAKGVMEILELLPIVEIKPKELQTFLMENNFNSHFVYVVHFLKGDLYKHKQYPHLYDAKDFALNPGNYKSRLEDVLQYLSILVNGIYWEPKFPKIVTKKFLKQLYSDSSKVRLKVIGDITCDIDGSIECTVKATDWTNPIYTYNPITGETTDGWTGNGIVMMTVDKLPTELPREASEFFGDSLSPFLSQLANTNFNQPYAKLLLPKEFQNAVIVHKGKLTPNYQYLSQYLP